MRRRPLLGDEAGAALPLALLAITVLALTVAASLSIAQTSVLTTVQLRDATASSYAADGATEAAVNAIRRSTFNGSSGQCFGTTDTLNLPNFHGSKSAAVRCDSTSSSVPINCTVSSCNRPNAAILTLGLGVGLEDGVYLKNDPGNFLVNGKVVSNANIEVNTGSLVADAGVYAKGGNSGCSGSITVSTGTAQQCLDTATSGTLKDDPNYTADIAAVPTYRTVPTCTVASTTGVSPGYYDDAVALTALTTNCSKVWFQPGTYYFDFHNAENRALSGTSKTWTIQNSTVIGGTLSGSSGMPGACISPLTSKTAAGVQFIFGGDSRVAIASTARVELCGTYRADRPPIVLYGLKSGSETSTTLASLKVTAVNSGSFTGATVSALLGSDGNTASWSYGLLTLLLAPLTGTMTVSGFAPTATIPVGSTLKGATLKVVHRNRSSATNGPRTVAFTPTGTASTKLTVSLSNSNSGTLSETLDLMAVDSTNSLAKMIHNGTFTGATAVYSASVPALSSGTEEVDSIELTLTYSAPALRAQSGCVTTAPYPGATGCAFLTTSLAPKNSLFIQGTTYVPRAALDLSFNSDVNSTSSEYGGATFAAGIIARNLSVVVAGSLGIRGPLISTPSDSPGVGFAVYLSAYICDGAGPCSTSGTPRLTAFVGFKDPTGIAVAGARQVTLYSWSVPR